MAKEKLTKTKIEKLTKPGIYSDGAGLYLRVRVGGSKSWHFIWKKDGKRSEIALGPYPGFSTRPVTLERAREKADEIRDRLERGDEVESDKEKDERPTFRDIMRDVIDIKQKASKNAKHAAQWAMTLETYASALHGLPVADITLTNVADCLKPIWSQKPETADRTRMRIATVMDAAKVKGYFVGDNPAAWKGALEHVLPARSKLSRGHHAALDYKSMPKAMKALREASGVSARAVEFAALTAGRSGEIRGAVFSEIDFDAALWIIPKERMKAGVEHRVPLSPRAVEILREREQFATGSLVFEGGKEGQPISDTAMVKALRLASGTGDTLHGLRSTFRDWAGDETHYAVDVAEAALAHAVRDKTEAAYRRSDALEKRRALMADWAAYCASFKK